MPALTAILISYNEELDLPRALASLAAIADEIIVVDSGSTDRTVEIAKSFGAQIYTRKLDSFADQKNYAASLSSHDWVLSIDCDNELSPELRSSLLQWKHQIPARNGYEILLFTNYLGSGIPVGIPNTNCCCIAVTRANSSAPFMNGCNWKGPPDDCEATYFITPFVRLPSTVPSSTPCPRWPRKNCLPRDARAGAPR